MSELLDVQDLRVRADTPRGTATILRDVSLRIPRRRIVGVVGESGSGKSTLALALLRLLPGGLRVAGGRILLDGTDLLTVPEATMERVRGVRLAMIFQDPMGALNPLFTVGTQLLDVLRHRHPDLSRREAVARASAMLARVGMPDAAARLRAYPHELSGGQRQRVVIAMALLAEPELIIADEPTTALDATVEAQIAALFEDMRARLSGSMLFISHHLGLVAQLCDEVCVLYAGSVVETGAVAEVMRAPLHPYTQALLDCEIDGSADGRLRSIPGEVPDPVSSVTGCVFAPRCAHAVAACREAPPALREIRPGGRAACIRAEELADA